jgi:aspartyl protease family protein
MHHFSLLAWLCCMSFSGLAAEVGVAGVFPGKALLMIGGAPRTVALGQTTEEGVKVVAIQDDRVTVEVGGRTRVLRVGQYVAAAPAGDDRASVSLPADSRGHYYVQGAINGGGIRFLVDTGATLVSIGAGDARRLGIDTSRAPRALTQTANGTAVVWKVKFDSVRIGSIVLNNVDGLVHPHDMPIALLGMSVLNRMEMQREGSVLTLKKRY